MKPEQLVEKMARSINMDQCNRCFTAECMLRIVLQAIKDGEVVEIESWGVDDLKVITLNPDFQRFMDEK